jgi:mono/diheme cytochrome c family protein
MKRSYFLLAVIIVVMTNSSCYNDKKELLGGSSVAATTCADAAGVVSYSKTVAPLLQQHCYSCHGSSSASGGIVMGSFDTDKAIAQNGKLYGSINHTAGFSPMPKGAPKLSSCQVAAIKKWIDTGVSNN